MLGMPQVSRGSPHVPPSSQRGVGRGVHGENPFCPSLIFPLHSSPMELLENSNSLLADLLCFSKNNKNVY